MWQLICGALLDALCLSSFVFFVGAFLVVMWLRLRDWWRTVRPQRVAACEPEPMAPVVESQPSAAEPSASSLLDDARFYSDFFNSQR